MILACAAHAHNFGMTGTDKCASADSKELKKSSDCARHYLNWCDIYEVAKMVHGNWSL